MLLKLKKTKINKQTTCNLFYHKVFTIFLNHHPLVKPIKIIIIIIIMLKRKKHIIL